MQHTPWMRTSSYTDTTHAPRRPLAGQRRGVGRRGPCRTWALGTTVALAVALAGLPPVAMAAVHIIEVQVDEATDTLTITGQDFAASGALLVRLGEVIITTDCHVDSPTLLTCVFTSGLPDPGDYRLTVAKGSGTGYHYDLTIGAVGPQGPPGTTARYTRITCTLPGDGVCNCAAGEAIISGGAKCPEGAFLQESYSLAPTASAWKAVCADSTGPTPGQAGPITILCCASCGGL